MERSQGGSQLYEPGKESDWLEHQCPEKLGGGQMKGGEAVCLMTCERAELNKSLQNHRLEWGIVKAFSYF